MTSKLLSKLTAPLEVLRAIAPLAAVSCAEYRVFDWLLREYWPSLCDQLEKPERLQLEFWGTNLVIHWTGDQSVARRVVLVAHVDREGYVLTTRMKQVGSSAIIEAFHPSRKLPREDVARSRGARVTLVQGGGAGSSALTGGSLSNGNIDIDGHRSDGSVLLSFPADDIFSRWWSSFAASDGLPGRGTCHLSFEETGDGLHVGDDGSLRSWCIDNAAGVAAASTALAELVLASARVNVSLVYSSGEESGFVGLLDMLLNCGDKLKRLHEQCLWLAVDASDSLKSRHFRLGEWNESLGKRRMAGYESVGERCQLANAYVRLADKAVEYDVGVCQFLYQAALQARQSADHMAEAVSEHGAGQYLGRCGAFWGGVSEATILAHLGDLLRTGGGPADVRVADHVGAVAIPLLNYRNIGRDAGAHALEPEETSSSALSAAKLLVESACYMYPYYSFGARCTVKYDSSSRTARMLGPNRPRSTEDLLTLWQNRIARRAKEYTAVTVQWINSIGAPLCSDLSDTWRTRNRGKRL